MELCSACLLGFYCRYDGDTNISKAPKRLIDSYKSGSIIPVCPEQLGGLSTPRDPSEIQGKSGEFVLDGLCKVLSNKGIDLTPQFLRGANEVLEQAKTLKINTYIAVPKSPSCGLGQTYDGTFTKTLIDGDGVTVALLKRYGIEIKLPQDF